jgi:hypothetical protein
VVTSSILVGVVFTPWALVWGAGPLLVTLTGWFWPKERAADAVTEPLAPGDSDSHRTGGAGMSTRRALNVASLPDHAFGHQGLIWWARSATW